MTLLLSHHKVDSEIFYPESDGLPMADNTVQFQYITTIESGLEALFTDREDVFVAGDLLWFPVQGSRETRVAPDVLVVFGRPKGHRGSYKQWEEDNIPLQIVFEILSPGNTLREMARKFDFYSRHGVEEYYLYDPETYDWTVWTRQEDRLRPPDFEGDWVSPRLQVRFHIDPVDGLILYRPDGERFKTFVEVMAERNAALARAEQAENERDLVRAERDIERDRAERLAARLRELGIDPDSP